MSWSHRLATLEPSPSFATVIPINPTTTNNPSRSSHLNVGWLNIVHYHSYGYVHVAHLLTNINDVQLLVLLAKIPYLPLLIISVSLSINMTYCFLFTYLSLFHIQKKCRELFMKHFLLFKRCIHLHVLLRHKEQNHLFVFRFFEKSVSFQS